MSDQRSFDHSIAVSVREYSLRAWEQGQELTRLLEGLRTYGGAISSALASPEAGNEMIELLMQFGAAVEASERLSCTLSGLEETFSELRVVSRSAER